MKKIVGFIPEKKKPVKKPDKKPPKKEAEKIGKSP